MESPIETIRRMIRDSQGRCYTFVEDYDDESTNSQETEQERQLRIREDIESTSTAKLAPPLSETQLIQKLV